MTTEDEYRAFLIVLEGDRRNERLERRLQEGDGFSDTISNLDSDLEEIEIGLVSLDGDTIRWAALIRRGKKAADYKYHIDFKEIVSLKAFSLRQLLKAPLSLPLGEVRRAANDDAGRLRSHVWKAVLAHLQQTDSSAASALIRLEQLRQRERLASDSPAHLIMAQEKDAVGVAVDIFGIPRSDVITTDPEFDRTPPGPFLSRIRNVELRESFMLQKDSNRFPGWQGQPSHAFSMKFRRGQHQLTILNVNTHPLEEEILGVDLIYYHHTYHSFVMVQYKRMLPMPGGRASYRFDNDPSYEKEIAHMEMFEREVQDRLPAAARSVDQFRLHSRPFYFKLCPAIADEPALTKLMPGIYIPLGYWQLLVNSNLVIGTQGGLQVSEGRAERHLSNDLFVDLVAKGWIGSYLHTSDILWRLVEDGIARRHSVIFAYSDWIKDTVVLLGQSK